MPQVDVNPNEDTEFRSPSPELPTEEERKDAAWRQANIDDLDLALEDADGEEERILQRLRLERLGELSATQARAQFGRMYPISRPDYTREVTDASRVNMPGSISNGKDAGTGVVCFLYKPGMDMCRLLEGYLETLAAKHPETKFVSIVGDQCIPNYPDKNLPTMLIYRNGELRRQVIGLRPEIGLDGMKTTLADVELLLTAVGVMDPPQSTQPKAAVDDDEDDDRNRYSSIRSRQKRLEEEDAELDWD
ncbi:hypothetical protein MVES_002947 [Malassezia vespertilionis]|uniref:Phosducin domain-containing protein n=1 Tax=Malassezia vespertilionis TaxID=2020962 RepID=A0A2N1J9A9_9BASI|nr:hypothetical protein MVES_002947 [Malassezia vespertilionis]